MIPQIDVRILAIIGLILLVSLGYFSYLLYQDIVSIKKDVDQVKEITSSNGEAEGEQPEEYTFEDDSDQYEEVSDDESSHEGHRFRGPLETIPEGMPEIDELLQEPEAAPELAPEPEPVAVVAPKKRGRPAKKQAVDVVAAEIV